jgi:Mn2+/Fe2+ NRAMP family transporter
LLFSIPLGGLISIAILSTAASAFFASQIELYSLATLAPSLQPLLGDFAPLVMAIGLFSAGISSAITAPLAAAFALRGILNLQVDLQHWQFRAVWLTILVLGMTVSSLQLKPVNIILFAQVANGILLPLVTVYLLWIMNTARLGKYQNSQRQNVAGSIVLIITLILSGRSLLSAFGCL